MRLQKHLRPVQAAAAESRGSFRAQRRASIQSICAWIAYVRAMAAMAIPAYTNVEEVTVQGRGPATQHGGAAGKLASGTLLSKTKKP